jgi:hypothetical protein
MLLQQSFGGIPKNVESVNPRKVSASRRIEGISEHAGDSGDSVESCEKEDLRLGAFLKFEK